MPNSAVVKVLTRMKELRERRGISSEDLENRLLLGPGWITHFENGDSIPPLDLIISIIREIGSTLEELFAGIDNPGVNNGYHRYFRWTEQNGGILVRFPYGKYDAKIIFDNIGLTEFEEVIRVLRDKLGEQSTDSSNSVKADAVASSFLKAIKYWSHVNPSDLWYFFIYRAFCDPYNHPAINARLGFEQSWKRTGGWALEKVVTEYYNPFLSEYGIKLLLAQTEEKNYLTNQLELTDRFEMDKADVLIVGNDSGVDICFGIVHVKTSLAERRTDDVPLSRDLVKSGYVSPLWTLDCKATPSDNPINKGEFGEPMGKDNDKRSAKRKDIEDEKYFSNCFTYNFNSIATPDWQKTDFRIIKCGFSDPNDNFSRYLISEWGRIISR